MMTQHFFQDGAPGPLQAVLLGGGARAVAGVIMLPVTCGRFKYSSVFGALRSVCVTEGPAALFSGFMATLLRDVPFSGIYVMFYSQAKAALPTAPPPPPPSITSPVGCSRVLASLITQPADVVKTQVQVNTHLRTAEAIRHIYREQKLQGFFRGAVPRALRRTMMAAMAWTVYEQMMARFGLKS
ncbi:hypothetical protein F7725_003917 [Dissostichus mawsoni]|uniref:Solute carrier family 25 member 38 n=1 Tax=Dissostichus mawsoni TaxID=36200 RepID=A0A7J5YDI3_DISMA|nr:hypothetical protein F7725_003917 [Dissostichus mawsoni]